jgi:hypothetical protein
MNGMDGMDAASHLALVDKNAGAQQMIPGTTPTILCCMCGVPMVWNQVRRDKRRPPRNSHPLCAPVFPTALGRTERSGTEPRFPPGQHVRQLHQDSRRHHRGHSEAMPYAKLPCVRQVAQPAKAVGRLPA